MISLTSLQLQAALCIANCNSLTDDMPMCSLKTRLTIVLKIEKKTNARISLQFPKLFGSRVEELKAAAQKGHATFPKVNWKASKTHPHTVCSMLSESSVFEVWFFGLLSCLLEWRLWWIKINPFSSVDTDLLKSDFFWTQLSQWCSCRKTPKEKMKNLQKILRNVVMKYKLSVLTTVYCCFVICVTLFVYV